MRQKTLIIIAIGLVVLLAISVSIIFGLGLYSNETDMPFPKEVSGEEYIEKTPEVIQENDGSIRISWTLKKRCDYNEVDIQEENYKPDTDAFWGGRSTTCDESNGVYLCEVSFFPEEFVVGKIYHAQVGSHWCEGEVDIRSPVFTFTKQ